MIVKRLVVNPPTGMLQSVTYKESPHHDARPSGIEIDMVVVHGISLPPGQFGGDAIENFFCGELDASLHPYFAQIASLQVSSHLLIKRCGEIVQFVPFNRRAWHAGVSSFAGRAKCNDFSIGIELEGTDVDPYEDSQYQSLAAVIRSLMQAYPKIRLERVVGHADIAPGRKTDPGSVFDWGYLKGMLV